MADIAAAWQEFLQFSLDPRARVHVFRAAGRVNPVSISTTTADQSCLQPSRWVSGSLCASARTVETLRVAGIRGCCKDPGPARRVGVGQATSPAVRRAPARRSGRGEEFDQLMKSHVSLCDEFEVLVAAHSVVRDETEEAFAAV